MTHFTTSKASGLIVSVPEAISFDYNLEDNVFRAYGRRQYEFDPIQLPFPCTFLGLSHELTDEQCKEVVPECSPQEAVFQNFYRYPFYNYNDGGSIGTAKESFSSLLLSLGLDPKESYAILVNDKK